MRAAALAEVVTGGRSASRTTRCGGANKNATARDTKIAICSVVVTLVAVIAIIAGGARTEAGKKILKDAARDPVPDYERYQSMFTDRSWEGAMQPEV